MKYSSFKVFVVVMCGVGALFFARPVLAQDAESAAPAQRFFEADARGADSTTLIAGKTLITLWGVREIEGMPASFMLSARSGLENAIGANKVRCALKERAGNEISAQCTNTSDLDLGLYMLQQGYVVTDRSVLYGTVFETPYIQAERDAQKHKLGVWAKDSSSEGSASSNQFIFILGIVLFLAILGAFAALVMTIMRGFQKVTDAQQENTDMIVRERQLRDKEREIFATMLDAEIKANKSRVEAYLVVYDEMLKDLRVEDAEPKYKRAGDIVQAQPALGRAVFDRNTDKLDILGNQLSSEVIHFYARIKSKPDYINLEPEMPVEEVMAIVEKAHKGAERLNKVSDKLIDLFAQGGHASEDY